MSSSIPADDQAILSAFESHLASAGFTRVRAAQHLETAEAFLGYLRNVGVAVAAATPEHLSRYLRTRLQGYRRRHRRSPHDTRSWRQREGAGIRRLLAHVQGRWPPEAVAANETESAVNFVLKDYERALRDERVLASATIVHRLDTARRFLRHVSGRDLTAALGQLSVTSIDQYIKRRAITGMARSTCRALCINLRSLLRFLGATSRMPHDLAPSVITPSSYRYEGLPSTISAEQIRAILAAARKDRSDTGIRDYAVLQLLAIYGLRAGEICQLRLDDIDWRGERLWIRHAKTGGRTCLPLLPQVGEALLSYLRQVRPACPDREVFIRMHAPRRAFLARTAIYSLLRRHLAGVGIRLNGKRGPHIFRHARAASLLMTGVPLKTVGDLLGHRSAAATAVYLKIDDSRLREVALSLPVPEVSP